MEHIIHRIAESIVVADPSQPGLPFVFVNESFLSLTGFSRQEVLGSSWGFLQSPNTPAAVKAQLTAALAAEEDVSVEVVTRRKDGSEFWNLLRITHVRDQQTGKLLQVRHKGRGTSRLSFP